MSTVNNYSLNLTSLLRKTKVKGEEVEITHDSLSQILSVGNPAEGLAHLCNEEHEMEWRTVEIKGDRIDITTESSV